MNDKEWLKRFAEIHNISEDQAVSKLISIYKAWNMTTLQEKYEKMLKAIDEVAGKRHPAESYPNWASELKQLLRRSVV